MDNNSGYFIWSDNWHIEGKKAWLVDGQRDILFSLDLENNNCEYIAQIPNLETNKFRLNQKCIKIGNDIFCMPDNGKSIWVYNVVNSQFSQIEVYNPCKARLWLNYYWEYNSKIFALSFGLKKIIEIDIKEKKIYNYFTLSDVAEEELACGIRVGTNIYCVSSVSNKVYQFNLESKQIMTHSVPTVEGGFQTISFDGQAFWLSGYCKEVCVWDEKNNLTKVLSDFPENFGAYDFTGNSTEILDCGTIKYDTQTFLESIFVGQYIWFIPFQTNQIIYVDIDTYQMNVLEIDGEQESRESLQGRMLRHKYLVQYVRDERYIGLYSLKNNCIIEIDTLEKKVEKKLYSLDEQCIDKIISSCNGILNEKNCLDRIFLRRGLSAKISNKNRKYTVGQYDKENLQGKFGEEIYHRLIQ